MAPLSRRSFFKTGALAAALPLGGLAATAPASAAPADPGAVALGWLDGAPALGTGSTFGVPWPRGALRRDQAFVLSAAGGAEIPCQSWPTAFWPDGSLKWTAHALPSRDGLPAQLSLKPGTPARAKAGQTVTLDERPDAIVVDTGVIACTVPRKGADIIGAIRRGGQVIARNGHLVALCDDQPDGTNGSTRQSAFQSEVARVTVEQRGPVRSVLKVEGRHRAADGGRSWLPFTLRLYFYAGAESVRIMHTFVFDGDEAKDFVRGIGLRLAVPLADEPHNRHVRFGGEDGGLWAEGVRNLTGLRRDPGEAVRKAQLAGLATPEIAERVRKNLHLVPAWGDYSLSQLSADSFRIRKRTKAGHGWVDAAWGRRAPGLGYIGGTRGGVAFGLRDFWQRHPTGLDVRNAHTDAAQVTLWMYSPDAPAMDLRFYHDGMGMDTHAEELQGLDITYEDYEKGFGTPVGVARSSEITLWALGATPPRERLAQMAAAVQTPPQAVATPAHILATRVFGNLWSLPDRSTPARAQIEDRLDAQFDFYRKEVDQRRWYGFWDYGDVRHTYDADRHEWRYDVGGYAWANSELSPDLWLWYSFLRTGRADIFRMGEAMVRHTSEVDTYHLGRFAGLGTRHNVQHWGCSAKQVRISTSVYRRMYYYLTADERTRDVMRETLDADRRLGAVDPVRKLANQPPKGPYPVLASFGTDWASLVANWLTEWERTGSAQWRDRILGGMRDIAAMPHGFFNAERMGYEPDTGRLHNMIGTGAAASHLNAVFGAVEIFDELIALTGDRDFERAWLEYCELYNAPVDEQRRRLGKPHGGADALYLGNSRLTAYAAWKRKDPALAQRAWKEFTGGARPYPPLTPKRVGGTAVLNPVNEVPWVTTNDSAQWGLAAIQNLALVGDALPRS
ncbi:MULTISPECIES: Tat pathway signal sequence domain protein [unclassified Massilia]|uniref:exo-rhamnogalacturonan lyase family protein n=1 Tax=unclassified Massilia TaxID=2609279 RepID=UPI00177CD2CD|nr:MULTISPECIES: Tat pathway signal sequence domain protein [unclassified Massilia]MBD8530014.1 Tat pathway signal sequence domain protein [Massilia sp. CFBP 13647]MBD8673932.1 Tat pathway signal sequence domain protein [Massilia sp. CFBP 13721]